jgi:hypothetical protein
VPLGEAAFAEKQHGGIQRAAQQRAFAHQVRRLVSKRTLELHVLRAARWRAKRLLERAVRLALLAATRR